MSVPEYDYIVTVPVRARNADEARGMVVNALIDKRHSLKRSADRQATIPSEMERQHVLDALADDYLAMAEGLTVRTSYARKAARPAEPIRKGGR